MDRLHIESTDTTEKRRIDSASILRRLLLGSATAVACATLAGCASSPSLAASPAGGLIAPERLVAVTDHISMPLHRGCCDITLADSTTGAVLSRPRTQWADSPSVGQVAVSSDGAFIAWNSNNNVWFVRILIWRPSENRWVTGVFYEGWMQPTAGAIAISPDDETLLVAADNGVWKYAMSNVSTRSLGPAVKLTIDPGARRPGNMLDAIVAAAIVFAADSRTAYVVANDGYVYTLDVDVMAWRGERVPYGVAAGPLSHRARRTFAALSPDERWLIINRGKNRTGRNGLSGELNVVDLSSKTSSLVVAPGIKETWGVEFNYFGENRGLLAVHGRETVSVLELDDGSPFEVASATIPPPSERSWMPSHYWQARFASLAWSGDGNRLVVNQGGNKEWRILELTLDLPRRLETAAIFESCVYNDLQRFGGRPQGFDVAAVQKRPTLTTTPTPSDTPTVTLTPTHTPTPTSTGTPLPPSPTPTAPPSATATATASRAPLPIYLPLALRESCGPEHRRADIALVLDTSSSMTGRKLEDAKAAALLFVGMIDLDPGRSQVAVVRYDRKAEVLRELTRSRTLIEAAIRSLRVRSGTHIDKGLRAALGELQSPRHLDRNLPVMILLTDGQQTGTPGEELRAAAEVRQAGVRLYTIGLGSDVDETALKTMAGSDDRYYYAPDSGDLAKIYGEIAQDLMCPGKELWGGR